MWLINKPKVKVYFKGSFDYLFNDTSEIKNPFQIFKNKLGDT